MCDEATHDEIAVAGYERGYDIASCQDIPNISPEQDEEQCEEILRCRAFDAEENNRSYSPFEFTAYEINSREDADEVWEIFDSAIAAGIDAFIATVNFEESDE